MVLYIPSAYSQLSYSGIVYEKLDNRKEPVAGANIYWSGTNIGTSTDATGSFEIPSHPGNTLLVVSFVGYKPDTISVSQENSKIEVVLSQDRELAEVTIASRQSGSHLLRSNPITTVQITSAELCKAACCSLAESFETNASVDVSYTDAATGAKQIQLLGLSGTYVQMLTENMANSRGLASAYGLDFTPGPWMESIQISKGASSVTNGYESLTGQINLQFKKPATSERFFINGFGSSSGRIESNVNGAVKVNEKWKTAILAHASTDSRKNDHNNDNFLDEPLTKRYNFMNRWEFKANNYLTTQFGVRILQEERTGGQKNFDRDKNTLQQDAYGITVDTKNFEAFFKTGYIFPKDENKSIAIVANYTHHIQESVYGRRFYDGKQNYFLANLIFVSDIGKSEHHKYTAGINYLYDNLDEAISGNDIIANDGNRKEIVPGTYFQYTYNIPEKVSIITGIRADHHNSYGTFFTPRIHLRYNITEKTAIRASAGKGYRTPNVLAEYNPILASSRVIEISDNIKQEEGWNYGLNLTRYIKLGNRELTLNLEYYFTNFKNQLILDLDTDVSRALFYNLSGKSRSNVFQAEASLELVKGLDMVAAWRLNNVKTTTNNLLQRKILQSKYKGLVNLSYATPLRKWQFDFTAQLNGPGRIPSTSTNPEEYHVNETFNSYQIYNGQVTKFFRSWNIYAGVENIGDFTQKHPIIDAANPFGDYFDSSLVWGPLMGRKIYFGFRFSIDKK